MNGNDLLAQGAEPLMFLDYFGCSRLSMNTAASFVEGVAHGCREASCALVGGETAEMPGMYKDGDYDVAGAAVGVMMPYQRLPRREAMVEGDVLIGLASNGVHSNGYSLARRIVEQEAKLSYTDRAPWDQSKTVGESLLTPTRIYVKPVLKVIRRAEKPVKGLAHITGGGLTENVPRMLPPHLAAEIDVTAWDVPAVFKWLKQAGNVDAAEMARVFNNGIGMVAVVGEADAATVISELEGMGENVYKIGRLVPRISPDKGCQLTNLSGWC
jgi:phosphoribosylamine--glycine ligase/phosphoribosylformylglycinamidine cyclo-ligase